MRSDILVSTFVKPGLSKEETVPWNIWNNVEPVEHYPMKETITTFKVGEGERPKEENTQSYNLTPSLTLTHILLAAT